jgi:CRISPR/Cas system-associated endonuclease Cas1
MGKEACQWRRVYVSLHSPKPGRLSLSYDVLELHRTAIAETVFNFATKRMFKRDDFEVDARGVVRLGAPLARELAAHVLRGVPFADVVAAVKRAIKMF